MVDDGYLVGYEDSNGNFVEVGRFNNTSENVSDPLVIQHADSGETMELGPNGFSTNSVSTGDIAIGPNDTVVGVETGTVTADGTDNSSGNDNWGQSEVRDETVNFSSSFDTAPQVVLTRSVQLDNVPEDQYLVSIKSISQSGFKARFRQVASVDNSGVTNAYGATWIAVAVI